MNTKINVLTLFIVASVLLSCQDKESSKKQNKNVSIELTKKNEVGPFSRRLNPFANVDTIPKDLRGIPKADTVSVQMIRFFSLKKLNQMLSDQVIDSITFNTFQYGIYGVSGFDNGQQFLIIDANNNKDFSDDKRLDFNRNYRILAQKDKVLRDSVFPVLTLRYQDFKNGKIVNQESLIQVFPYKDYFNFKDPKPNIKLYTDLQLVGQFNEHWQGNIKVDSKKYKIATRTDRNQTKLLIAEEGSLFKPEKRGQYYRTYKISDTLSFEKTHYSIDSLSPLLDRLYLTSVKAPIFKFGYKAGDIIADFKLETLDGNQSSISKLLENKDYLLIDFWGTWCAPCIELTPDLIDMDKNTPSLSILGVAYDFKKEPVVEYVKDNNLGWSQIYEQRVRKDSLLSKKIVGNLKVETYPTYILLDKNRRILHRGIGRESLQIIKGIVQ